MQSTYGVLSCFGCGRTGPYKMVNGHPYCKLCRDEGVPISDQRLLNGLDPVTGSADVAPRYAGPYVPVEWGDLPAFVRFRVVERETGRWRIRAAKPDYVIPYPDWSELQDPRD